MDCTAVFPRKNQLDDHIFAKHDDNLFVCLEPTCGKKYKVRRSRDHHMTTHHLKDYRYPCTGEVCTKGYNTKDTLDWHKYKVHNIDKPVICGMCNNEISGKIYLQIRHKLTCGQPKDIKCRDAQCKKKFKAEFLMDSHYVKWHTDQGKVFVC